MQSKANCGDLKLGLWVYKLSAPSKIYYSRLYAENESYFSLFSRIGNALFQPSKYIFVTTKSERRGLFLAPGGRSFLNVPSFIQGPCLGLRRRRRSIVYWIFCWKEIFLPEIISETKWLNLKKKVKKDVERAFKGRGPTWMGPHSSGHGSWSNYLAKCTGLPG